jgi:hypothetical protein
MISTFCHLHHLILLWPFVIQLHLITVALLDSLCIVYACFCFHQIPCNSILLQLFRLKPLSSEWLSVRVLSVHYCSLLFYISILLYFLVSRMHYAQWKYIHEHICTSIYTVFMHSFINKTNKKKSSLALLKLSDRGKFWNLINFFYQLFDKL